MCNFQHYYGSTIIVKPCHTLQNSFIQNPITSSRNFRTFKGHESWNIMMYGTLNWIPRRPQVHSLLIWPKLLSRQPITMVIKYFSSSQGMFKWNSWTESISRGIFLRRVKCKYVWRSRWMPRIHKHSQLTHFFVGTAKRFFSSFVLYKKHHFFVCGSVGQQQDWFQWTRNSKQK
jgi:hypothetical protein